jgi:uncharacterized membrane protein
MKNNSQQQSSDGHQGKPKEAETDPIGQNIEAIAELHKHSERQITTQQRAIEAVTAFLGRPLFLFLIMAFVVLWVLVNIVLAAFHLPSFDPPPFIWLSGVLSLGALLQATVILITQNRQDAVDERRTQLDLQVSLVVDQKLSKLIAMVDEIRQATSPDGKKHDPQADAMKESVDPHRALSSLEHMLEKAEEEARNDT